MNELVRMSTQEISKGIPVTDSLIVSERFEVSHLSVTKLIDKYAEDSSQFGKLTSFQMTRDSQRTIKCYELNEQQFSLLVMYMKNTKIAREYKMKFVKAFYFMKNELLARSETRHIGIKNRKLLTDAIRDKVDEGTTFKAFAYGNYSKLVYKKVLGETVKSFKERNGLTKEDNVRNHLTIEQLEKVQDIESKIATYLEIRKDMGESDKQIYDEIKNHIQ